MKTPKLYFYDTGLACALLNLRSVEDLNSHFAKGALFSNFVMNHVHHGCIVRRSTEVRKQLRSIKAIYTLVEKVHFICSPRITDIGINLFAVF